jgi:hypothetical protein
MPTTAIGDGNRLNRQRANNAQVFKGRLIFAANMVGGFWLGITAYFAFGTLFVWPQFQSHRIIEIFFVTGGIVIFLALFPGRLLAMWPYAITLETQKGIWVYAPPSKIWIPLDEIVDVDVYSGSYGGGHVIQLKKSYGLVKQLYIISLFFPDEQLVRALRSSIDRRDGAVYSS